MNVKIKSGDIAYGTKVTTTDGAEIEGLTNIDIRIAIDDVNRADLTLHVAEVEVEALATVYVRGKEVRRIEYADGTTDEFPAA